jgi:Trp operon repressor
MPNAAPHNKKKITDLTYVEVLERLESLKVVTKVSEKGNINLRLEELNQLFEQARKLVNTENFDDMVGLDNDKKDLTNFALIFDNSETIKHLFDNKEIFNKIKDHSSMLGILINTATIYKRVKILELLTENGECHQTIQKKFSKQLNLAIKHANKNKNVEISNILLTGDNKQTFNNFEYSEILNQFLENNLNSNEINQQFTKAIKLVNKGNVNIKDQNNIFSLLEYAARYDDTKTIKYLLKYHLNNIQPQILADTIKSVSTDEHDKTLKTLLNNKQFLDKVIAKHADSLTTAINDAITNNQQETLKILVSNDKIIKAIRSQSTPNDLYTALTTKFELDKETANLVVQTRNNVLKDRTFFQKIGTAITDITDGLKEAGTQVFNIIKNKVSNKSDRKNTNEQKTVAPAEVTTHNNTQQKPFDQDKEQAFNSLKENSNKKPNKPIGPHTETHIRKNTGKTIDRSPGN